MLNLIVNSREYYDSQTETFIEVPQQHISLEHSLVAISKWESTWMKPFLTNAEKSEAEIKHYIQCMNLEEKEPINVDAMDASHFISIMNYIQSPMTATTINKIGKNKPSREIVTSELVYYWMISLNIPFECQYWHINRLLTLIEVCNVKNSPPKKESKKDILARNAALNAARKKSMNTSG